MSRLLFLTRRMKQGYGVDLEVHEVSARLTRWGHTVAVLCLEADGSFKGPYEVRELAFATVADVSEFARPFRPDVVTAFTSPFFEMLPSLSPTYDCWAWENGDPTPALFPKEKEERERVKRHKIDRCYPVLTGVVTISEFLRRDIEWPSAHVVYLGSDHAPDRGEKKRANSIPTAERPLRVGTLMRLGKREANYKGNDRFLSLADLASRSDTPVEFSVMGRGTRKEAREFLAAGFQVSLNASDEEKWDYLRNLDVFVSCSLWEGFNLPLVEAQALGTVGIAFDTGAHPEVTPMVFHDTKEMLSFLLRAKNPDLLFECSRNAYRYVRDFFRWDETAARFLEIVLSGTPHIRTASRTGAMTLPALSPGPEANRSVLRGSLVGTVKSVRNHGWRITARKIKCRLARLAGRLTRHLKDP